MNGIASASSSASASASTLTFPSIKIQSSHYINPCNSVLVPNLKICPLNISLRSFSFAKTPLPQRRRTLCRSSNGPGVPGSGENESRNVLDAFFLGKALAEALNERIESTVGEILSVVGRLQAEQQKQVADFQEEVLERAKRAKEKAAREAMEAQGLTSKSTVVTNGAASKASPPTVNARITANSSSYNPPKPAADIDSDLAEK